MKTFTKPLALSLALSAALAAPAWADPAAFTVLTLEQAPTAEAMPALAAQLKTLQVDAVSVRQVQRGIGQVDPLQVLADGLGYAYRFIAAGKDDGQTQRGQAVLTRLPIAAESGPDQPGLNYLRLDDGRHTVAVYTDAGAGAAQLPALVTRSRLGAPAVLLGAVAGDRPRPQASIRRVSRWKPMPAISAMASRPPAVRRSRWKAVPCAPPC